MSAADGDAELIRGQATNVISQALAAANGNASTAARLLQAGGLLVPRLGPIAPAEEPADRRRAREQACVEAGGHCFDGTGEVLTSHPAQYPEQCKHCPATRVGRKHREPMAYRYPEGQP